MRAHPSSPLRVLGAAILCGLASHTPAQDLEFAEQFAFGADRANALERLIPGTEEHFFYSCLHLQNERRLAEVPPLLGSWIQRYGRTARAVEIENRQALLGYAQDPGATFAFLRDRLGLSFDREREVPGAAPDLPTRLDPALLSATALTEQARRLHPGSLDGFRDSALRGLAATTLDDASLRALMQRLREPDLPNLANLVVRELRLPDSAGFGALPIHQRLLLDQLEDCAQQMPALLDDGRFVAAWIRRLRPGADDDIRRDAAARTAFFDRLQAFADRLPAAHNSLKAHVLFHRLQHQLALGRPDRDRFLAYLRLPRPAGYVEPRLLERTARREQLVDQAASYPTGLPSIGDDEALVRAYLEHFLRDAQNFEVYAGLIRADWLRRVFAETKILAGVGDMQRWYAMLDDPAYYEALRDRVEIRFPPTAPESFELDGLVALEVDLKNVPTLLVKVFQVDTFNFQRGEDREPDAAIDLDGLVANEERTLELAESPLRRVRRTLTFPSIQGRGVWIVELIGNGISSRALIRKGRLQMVEHPGAAGHEIRVLDERGSALPDATVWFGGKEYRPRAGGEVVVPYSTQAGTRPLILRLGAFSTLSSLEHRAEEYALDAAVHVERESLRPGALAKILVRPTLSLCGRAIGIGLLEAPMLAVSAVDQDGTPARLDVRDLQLAPGRELVQEIRVPAGTVRLEVSLRGQVRSMTTGEPVELASATEQRFLNRIEATDATSCPLLGRTPDGFVLDVLGKDGEPKADRAVTIELEHRDYADPVLVTLKTDARGRIELGELPGVLSVRSSGFPVPGSPAPWHLERAACTVPEVLHGLAGTTLRVPYPGRARSATRSVVSLLELRGGVGARDAFDRVAIDGGFVELRALAAGDYELRLKETGDVVEVSVTAGERRGGLAVGSARILELPRRAPLQVSAVEVDGDALLVRLSNANADTRVHVVATRYVPAFDAFRDLLAPERPRLRVLFPDRVDSTYRSGREIGDEYRYILERRLAARFPGNMLPRPGLLLNPWALDETTTAPAPGGAAGERYEAEGQGSDGRGRAGKRVALGAGGTPPGEFPCFDFLPAPAGVVANLRPDGDGVVRVPFADLGAGQLVEVLAVDDASTVRTSLVRDEVRLEPVTRTLREALDFDRHATLQSRIDLVAGGGTAVVEDAARSRLQVYGSLVDVYRLFRTLSNDADLAEFEFVLRWPTLDAAERRELYSKHACHELNLFLQQKDPTFFADVVRPYLRDKREATFLDDWLLDLDLARYLEPWAFARLNVVERILLARRVGDQAAVARDVADTLDLVPPDPERARARFRSVVHGDALAATGRLLEQSKKVSAPSPEPATRAGRPAAAPKPNAPPDTGGVPALAETEGAWGEDLLERHAAEKLLRDGTRALYRAPEPTRRYVEHHYWHRRIEEQVAELIEPNAFWRDFATAPEDVPFVSTHVADAAGSFAEMMLALAVLDLPFAAAPPQRDVDGSRLTVRAATPLLLAREELRDATSPAEPAPPVLVSQNLFRLDEPFRFDGNQQRDAYLTGELIVDVAYGCRVVVTNPTSSPRSLDLLLQIPEGAIPVQNGAETRGLGVQLDGYATRSVEYAFYFPRAGEARHYPAQVTEAGALVASAAATTWDVVDAPSVVDTTSWEHVSQDADAAAVLAFLDRANLHRLDLSRIAWRLRDRAFFGAALERLRDRHVYDGLLWSYGILHGDQRATAEYLRHAGGFLTQCGRCLETPLVVIDPVERRAYQHVEFEPLFNARAHRFGRERRILDAGVDGQYRALLDLLAYRPQLDADDWLWLTYYLLLQDRTADALATFANVDASRVQRPPGGGVAQLQYDYMRAYLDFFTVDHAVARGVAERYRDHPVTRWRERFVEVLRQLDEVEGRAVADPDPHGRDAQLASLAATEPSLELAVDAREVQLRYRNLERCEVSYFVMDVEFLFSTHPFVQQGSDAFSYVRPNRTDVLALPKDGAELAFDLPDEFRNANVLIEVRGAGLSRRQACYANSLAVRWIETYGQLAVTDADSAAPLARVYVKVFARLPGGAVRFHKDGYTDLRGRFDYASVTGAPQAERFAILVLSEDNGATIREVEPPRP